MTLAQASSEEILSEDLCRLMKSEKTWQIASYLCLIAAVTCWLFEYADASFVVATLGILAWFVSLRQGLRKINLEAQNSHAEDLGEHDET